MKKSVTSDPVQNELVSYSEDKLQKIVVEPLLRAMGFKDVRDRSGVNERGKDLTAIKEEAFGKTYYAIQIKKTKLSGKVATTDSLSFVINQLRQAIQEKIVFPSEMQPIKPNRLIFITPYPMENSAVCALESSLSDVNSHGVSIVDGIQLSDLVRQHLPVFLTGEQIYRRNTFESSGAIIEASVALQTNRSLTMQDIYVDASIADNRNILNKLAELNCLEDIGKCLGAVDARDVKLIEKLSQGDFSFWHEESGLDELKKKYKEIPANKIIWPPKKKEYNEYNTYSVISPNELFSPLIGAASFCKQVFSSSTIDTCTSGDIQDGFNIILEINKFLKLFLKVPFYKKVWNKYIPSVIDNSFKLSAESLLHSKVPICIIGPAGAGKTTMLRHITRLAAMNENGEIPIFIPFLRLSNYSKDGIIDFVSNELLKGGYHFDGQSSDYKSAITGVLRTGGVRLHFDGLDESGHNIKNAINAIKSLHALYPKTPIILTSRHTVNIIWEDLVRFTIEPFNQEKLVVFIYRWFDAQPSAQKELSEWVHNHERLQTVAQTPLIAALLCVLYSADVDLPETEEELYSRRLELLLGQWDSAKGAIKMPKKRREAYKLFLIDLAFDFHISNYRERPYAYVVEKSKEYYKEFRDTPHAIVIDCISRGLLFRNENGSISFGHLTYQEHLTAMYLAKHNPVLDILENLTNPWWAKALQFYAMQMTSIDQLIKQVNKYKKLAPEKQNKLNELVLHAPYTKIKLKRHVS